MKNSNIILLMLFLPHIIAKAEISDEKLEELLEQGNYGSIFSGDVSILTTYYSKQSEYYIVYKTMVQNMCKYIRHI